MILPMLPAPAAYAAILRLTLAAIAIWCTLSSLEATVALRAFRPERPLGRDIGRLRREPLARLLLASPLASAPALATLPLARLAAGLALPFAAGPLAMALLLAILATTAAIALAAGGSDGADKIALVAGLAALLVAAGRWAGDPWLCLAGVLWGAGQLTIAYFTAGAAKMARPFWRDGTALAAVMRSHRWGHPLAAAIVRDPRRARALAWAVMLPELVFPLALVAPAPVCLAMLAMFAAFHLATAVGMGLNTYPIAFASAYPCLWAANHLLHGSLG